MIGQLIFGLLACVPLLLVLATWTRLTRTRQWPSWLPVVTLSWVTAIAIYSAVLFIYYTFRPAAPSLPPWQNPEILDFAMLFLLAPIGMILGAISGGWRKAPAWLILVVEIACVPLLLLGVIASAAD